MFLCAHEITLGGYRLATFESVRIEKTSEALSDVATITLPATVYNRPIQVEDKIRRGDRVTIRLGYDGDLRTEFTGFVRSISPNTPMKLECEDEIFLFRKPVKDKLFKNADVAEVLQYLIDQVNPTLPVDQRFKLVFDARGVRYEKLLVKGVEAYDVLEQLRRETGLALFCRGTELHGHLLYSEKRGLAEYDFARNIQQGSQLEYVRAEGVKVKVKVIGKTKGNANVEAEAGVDGGEVRTIRRPNISDPTALQTIANETLKRYRYDGYKGHIKTWLVPYVEHGYSAQLRDEEYPERAGRYYVEAVETTASASAGIERKVSLAFRLT